MKALTCEMCGSTNLIKEGGVFVCQSCGTKYSVEEAKKMVVEGTVDVKGTVKVDTSDELKNLYEIARRAKDSNNSDNAAKYYEQILMKDPNSWEANFYTIYFQSMSCRIGEIYSVEVNLVNNYEPILALVKSTLSEEEQAKVLEEIYLRISIIADIFFNSSVNYFKNTDVEIRYELRGETCDRVLYSFFMLYYLAAYINETFSHKYEQIAVKCLEDGVKIHTEFLQIDQLMVPKEENLEIINGKIEEIEQDIQFNQQHVNYLLQSGLPELGAKWALYLSGNDPEAALMFYLENSDNPEYKKPQYLIDLEKESEEPTIGNNVSNSTSGGCYVATAVYGSYDCPEVWTLRRFRDNTLAETWYGMKFIKLYYAISPKLVKWFGNTTWFKTLWRKPLDKLVNALNRKGVENTPYQD